jgi:hypothetical protein
MASDGHQPPVPAPKTRSADDQLAPSADERYSSWLVAPSATATPQPSVGSHARLAPVIVSEVGDTGCGPVHVPAAVRCWKYTSEPTVSAPSAARS